MEIRLLETEGRAGQASIEVDGQVLHVVDGVSAVGEPRGAGALAGVRLDAVAALPRDDRPQPEIPEGAAAGLLHVRGWRYLGWGVVVGLAPLRADLGVLELSLPDTAADDLELGERVLVEIDRIVLRPA